jgi:hypothetical protein
MKLKYCLSMLLLAIVSVFRFRAEREEYANAVSPTPNPSGVATVVLEATVATRHLLLAKGTGSASAILCTASLIPLGPTGDDAAVGDRVAVALLGAVSGTLTMVASKAIAENANVYATAGGKVTDAVVVGAY